MQTSPHTSQWHIAYTYSRCEKKVDQLAKERGLNTYLPLAVQERKWSDRIKKIEAPLFPNYIFIKATPKEIHNFQQIREVVNFLYEDSKLATMKESEIENIKKVLKGQRSINSASRVYEVGTKVKIRMGELAGVEGLLVRDNDQKQVVVQIESLGQSINVDVPLSYLDYQ